MSMAVRVLMMVGMVACLASLAHAIPGQATYYSPPYVPSSCFDFENRGVMIAAANPQLYANGAVCGRWYRIRCTGPTNQGMPQPCRGNGVDVTIVDLCRGCNNNQIEISGEAFIMIANPGAGSINIEYTPLQVYESAAEEEFGMIGTRTSSA